MIVTKHGELYKNVNDMYKKDDDIWGQSTQENTDKNIINIIDLLKKEDSYQYIYDFGCGTGYFLNTLMKHLKNEKTKACGYDISDIAINKAKLLFSDLDFKVFNLVEDCFVKNKNKSNQLVVIRGVLWYLFSEIEKCINNIDLKLNIGDFLCISQPFTRGNFVEIPSKNDFLSYFKKYKTIKESTMNCSDGFWYNVLLVKVGV